MRIVVVGDKSRYQFLRQLIPDTGMHSEKLVDKTIKLVDKNVEKNDDSYFSSLIPLNTQVVFPSGVESEAFEFNVNDLVLFFDEVPFQTEFEIGQLDKLTTDPNVAHLQVVLYDTKQGMLTTDVTTSQDAKDAAKIELLKRQIAYVDYPESGIDVFLWNLTALLDPAKKNLSKIKKKRELLQYTFSMDYEFDFLEIEDKIVSPIVLERLIKRTEQDVGRLVLETATNRAVVNCVRNEALQSMIENLYFKYLGELCVWDQVADLEKIRKDIQRDFKAFIKIKSDFKFADDQAQHELEINKYRNQVVLFKDQVTRFFTKELALILEKQFQKRLKRLETLLGEK